MNKLYTKLAGNDLKFSRFSFIKVMSLTSIAALLSCVSPVFSKNLDSREGVSTDIKAVSMVYPQSVISVYDEATDYLGLHDVSKDNYITVQNTALASNANVLNDNANFLTKIFWDVSDDSIVINTPTSDGNNRSKRMASREEEKKQSIMSPQLSVRNSMSSQQVAQHDENTATISVADILHNVSTAITERDAGLQRADTNTTLGGGATAQKKWSTAVGYMAHAIGESSTALGGEYNDKSGHGENDYTSAQGDYSTALGSVSKALEYGSTAVGHRAYAGAKHAVSIGFYSRAQAEGSIAIGEHSIAAVVAGVEGYSPLGKKGGDADFVWKSTYGAVSVGDVRQGKTRQIGGVAAGTEETDAVNIAQLKSLQTYVDKGWNLSVNGKNAKAVGIDDTVDFAAGSNLEITKGTDDNNIKFDLAKNITLESVKIAGGPQIKTDGINAGGKKITGVAAGITDTDAVNFAQLKAIQEAAVVKGLKINTTSNDFKDAIADGQSSIAIGSEASALGVQSMAFGMKSQATVNSGIAIGARSVADVGGSIAGYDPFIGDESGEIRYEWKSTLGAVSVGDNTNKFSRQITGVAAGAQDTDAVNVAQLKSLRDYVNKGWKLSVNGANGKVVGIDGTVDLAAGSNNFEITKSTDDNNIKFDLAKNITLDSIRAGEHTLDAKGLKIANGPQITTEGIHAGGKKITGVSEGTDETDAVNFGQLQKIEKQVEQQVAASSFVKQDDETRSITVGKDTDGNKIDLINKTGGARTLSGVKAGTAETDAVNFAQLQKVEKDVKEQLAASSFVKQDDETRSITVGKDTDGERIDITNNKSEKRILAGIKDGDISKDSNEAITGSQLFATNQNVITVSNNLQTAATNIATTFGGDAKYENGEWKAPTFTLKTINTDGEEKDETYHNVAEALSGVGSSITNVQNKISNEITNQINNAIIKVEGDSFIQQDKKTNRLTIGAKTEGTEINITNINGTNRIISGVEDAKNNNDAVNKGQLDSSIKNMTDQLTNITQQVQGDALLWSESDGAFVVQHGKEKTNSKLKFLLDGDITKDSNEAINGSQLYSMSNNLAGYFGGGAGYDENGKWQAPTFTLKTVNGDGKEEEQSYDTVEKALSAVGTSFTNIQNKITNEMTNEINKTKDDALLWDNEKEAFVAQHGEGDKKADSKIMHLKAGDIAAESTDAINGSQLYSVIHSLSTYFGGGAGYQNGEWKAPTFYVSQFKNDENDDNKKSYNDVAGAFEGVNESMESINKRINNVTQSVSSNGLNWNEKEKAYDARHDHKDSKIMHVADGNLSKDSKEAVNGSQLFETNNRVKEVDNRVSKVENRVNNIDQQIKNIENTVTNDAVKYDKDEKGDKINKVTLAGVSESDPVVLDNVAAGKVSEDSKEAVNGSQLWETNQKIDVVLDKAKKYTDERFDSILNNTMTDVINEAKSYTDMKFEALNYSIEGVRKEARQAAAIGLAVSNLRYNDIPGKLSVGFGTGLWRSQSALAFGAGYTSESGSVLSNVSVTHSGGYWGIGAGFNMTLN
ncbi:Vomp family autotransporter [Bartonella acomydis]|uniref:Surface protein/Bartonella adhesin n=1 Tax=Bartonella acomydis TaxID=686234 RepID=A0ABP9MNH0_9HYPH